MMTIFHWLWIITFMAAVIVEFATASAMVSIWFAVGAIVGLIAALLNADFVVQAVLFFIASFASLAIIRPLTANYSRGNVIHTNSDALIGVRTRLLKCITMEKYGEVKINGIHWNVVEKDGNDVKEGAIVEVLAIEGSKLIVKEC